MLLLFLNDMWLLDPKPSKILVLFVFTVCRIFFVCLQYLGYCATASELKTSTRKMKRVRLVPDE